MVNLTVSSKVANLGDTVTADCNLIWGNADNFGLSISVDGEEVKREESQDLAENIIITKRKANLTVTCKILIWDNKKELLTKEETLTVQCKCLVTETGFAMQQSLPILINVS